jgi:hypothetical protein
LDPATLAWALAQSVGSRAAVLASAYTGGVTRVTFVGRAIAALHGAENAAARRPGVTLAQFSRSA